jgi:hypothetical protein
VKSVYFSFLKQKFPLINGRNNRYDEERDDLIERVLKFFSNSIIFSDKVN